MKMAKLALRHRRLDGGHRPHGERASSAGPRSQEYFGVMPCTRHEHDEQRPDASSACETDVCGTISMHVLAARLADAQRAAGLEQQLRRRPRQGGLLPLQQPAQALLCRGHAWITGEIIAGTVGEENAYGTMVGRIKAGPMTFARVSTDDRQRPGARLRRRGPLHRRPARPRSAASASCEIPDLQRLLHFICENGFEHHVAANLSSAANAAYEATTRYLGWDVLPAQRRVEAAAAVGSNAVLDAAVQAGHSAQPGRSAAGADAMDIYHAWCDLKPGVKDLAFAEAVAEVHGPSQGGGADRGLAADPRQARLRRARPGRMAPHDGVCATCGSSRTHSSTSPRDGSPRKASISASILWCRTPASPSTATSRTRCGTTAGSGSSTSILGNEVDAVHARRVRDLCIGPGRRNQCSTHRATRWRGDPGEWSWPGRFHFVRQIRLLPSVSGPWRAARNTSSRAMGRPWPDWFRLPDNGC